MSETSINRLFHEDRFPDTTWKVIFLLLYSPVGIILALIRMCMVLQAYVAASLLRSQVSIRRFVLRIVCCALGILIEEDESECCRNKNARFLVANHSSLFDFIPIHLLTNCQTLVYCDLPDWFLHGIGLKNLSKKTLSPAENTELNVLRSESKMHKEPILLFPEKETTNGEAGLLKFDSWWISEVDSVQPIALQLRRSSFIDVKPSVLGSTWYSNYFWSFFVPYTVYSVRYLPIVEKKSNENDAAFAERLQAVIAEKLNIAKTNFSASDKVDYEKRCRKEKYRPSKLDQERVRKTRDRDELQRMAIQVAEVLPHVPREVIFLDLEITGSVDVTITNILEGKVQLVNPKGDSHSSQNQSEAVAGPSSPKTVTSTKPQNMTFQERKAKLIEEARKRYLEKHNLS